jgi:hypothetical protein
MLKSTPDMPQHLIWAIEHHRELVEDAHRARLATCRFGGERNVSWRRLRWQVGGWLINMGERLQPERSGTVWG